MRFLDLLGVAQEAARKDFLVTFGIKPTRPETGFGYLKVGNSIPDLVPSSPPRSERWRSSWKSRIWKGQKNI